MRMLALIALLAACETRSDKYCQKNPNDHENCGGMSTPDAPVDGPVCVGDGDCSGATPHCLDMMACVGCRDSADCTHQVCDTGSHVCRACTTSAECPSALCLAGACADPALIAYVGGNNPASTACTQAAPCSTLRDAIALPAYPKYVVVLSDVTETATVTLVGNHALEVFGGGKKIQFDFTGAGLDVKDQIALTLHDVQLMHTTASNTASDDGIFIESTSATLTVDGGSINKCGGDAIDAANGKVAIDRTVFSANSRGIEAFNDTELTIKHAAFLGADLSAIYTTTTKRVIVDSTLVDDCASAFGQNDAAIDVGGTIDLTNSIVTHSGDPGSATYGAVRIVSVGGVSHLDYVTLADNNTAALYCNNNLQTQLTNAIVTGNMQAATCKASYALVSDMPDAAKHSKSGDPKFLNTTDPTSKMYYRIGSTSAAIGIGMADAVTVDIDAQARTSTPDVGADEYVP